MPTNGVIISAIVALPFLLLGNIYAIAAVSNFGLIFSYIMASLAIFKIRRGRDRKASSSNNGENNTGAFKTPHYFLTSQQ